MPSEETRSTVVQAREIIRRLASIPVRLSDALARSDEDQIRAPASEGEWSAADILAHLRASDAIVAPRAYMILAREDPPLTAFDERRWAAAAGYAEMESQTLLIHFLLGRAELVATLRRLRAADWRRTGMHESRGPLTLLEVMRGLVEHEEEHCAQLEALCAEAASRDGA